MTILASMSAAQWFGLAGALLLLAGPGAALLLLHPAAHQWSALEKISVGAVLGMAAWPVLALFLSIVRLRLSGISIGLLGALGWCTCVLVLLRSGTLRAGRIGFDKGAVGTCLFASALVAHLILNLYMLRGIVVAPGIDSYHHTLIAQLVVDNGGLPSNYAPYAPLETFSYHFGFHIIAGLTSTLTGIPVRIIVPIIGQMLQTASLVSMAAFGQRLFGKSAVMLMVIAGLGFISPLPTAMANWARYPQLMGQVMLPCILILYRAWVLKGLPYAQIPWIALGICALGLTHYRVTLMAGLALVLLSVPVLTEMLRKRDARALIISSTRMLSTVLAVAALFVAWPARLLMQHTTGFPFVASKIGGGAEATEAAAFYGLDRLGSWVLDHPNLLPLLILAGLAMAYALARRNADALLLAAWVATQFVLSGPAGLGEYMDTVSVAIASYIPLGLLVAWMLSDIVRLITGGLSTRGRSVLALLTLAAAMGIGVYRGGSATLHGIDPANIWVSSADLAAADWIKANTASGARFAGTTFTFDYSPSWILGQDAAYWLPLLTQRHSTVPPMIYDIENAADTGYEQRLLALHAISSNFGSDKAYRVMIENGIDYVYLGSRAPVGSAAALRTSPFLSEVYEKDGVHIFQVMLSAQNPVRIADAQRSGPR